MPNLISNKISQDNINMTFVNYQVGIGNLAFATVLQKPPYNPLYPPQSSAVSAINSLAKASAQPSGSSLPLSN